ncbi:hypothetical protein UPYG_G00012300 [Umbra pygmaea]|uniref:DNA (cytosine-5-)-methyltransferase n=1 Tax=Umbra pygmaea TaxID=75934 RepID=A0ABD0XL72_UMBPY
MYYSLYTGGGLGMAVNIQGHPSRTMNRYSLLAWLNDRLKTRFTKVEHICSGAPYCQLMHWLFPDSVDLERVRFQAQDRLDALHNYTVLQASFRKVGVIKSIPVNDLIGGDIAVGLGFLNWFKCFFESKHNGQEYDAVKARAGQSILHAIAYKQSGRATGLTQLNISTELELPEKSLQDHEAPLEAQTAEPEGVKEDQHVPCSPSVIQLIQHHWTSQAQLMTQDQLVRHVLGQKYPQDITAACSQTPYCLYLYRGVALGREDGEVASAILVGYFDQGSGSRQVRLLDSLQQRDGTRSSDAAELVGVLETLRRFEIPVANMAMFYCCSAGCRDLKLSQVLVAGLKALSPGLVSLCGLPGLAGGACHAGLAVLPEPILELIKSIHHHYSTCSTTNDKLKVVFDFMAPMDLHSPLSSQVIFLVKMIKNMTEAWPDLLHYFESRDNNEAAKRVCVLLRDLKVRLTLIFLGHALEPLYVFQELFEEGTADVPTILLQASSLVHSYATSFLRAPAVDRFLRRQDASLLDRNKDYLQRLEVNLGNRAEAFLSEHKAELQDCVIDSFLESTVTFYKAISCSLMESLPLPSVMLKYIPDLLSPSRRLEVTSRSVVELATFMGLCGTGEVSLLTDEFLEYMIAEAEEIKSPRSDGTEEHWGQTLKTLEETSILRRLILALLTLPSGPLRRSVVFAQANMQCDRGPREDWLTEETEDSEKDVKPVCWLSPAKQKIKSGDVIDLTEPADTEPITIVDDKTPMAVVKTSENVDIIDLDDSDDDIIWTPSLPMATLTPEGPTHKSSMYQDGKGYLEGELIWGKVEGYSLWPGIVQEWKRRLPAVGIRKVEWFGRGMFSEINCKGLLPFGSFAQYFCPNSFATMVTYRDAIFQSLQLAGSRCKKDFSMGSDEREEHLRVMLDWAFGGFKPTGPDGFKPPLQYKNHVGDTKAKTRSDQVQPAKKSSNVKITKATSINFDVSSLSQVSVCLTRLSINLDNGTFKIKPKEVPIIYSPFNRRTQDIDPDYNPPVKKQRQQSNKNKEPEYVYEQPDQKFREEMIQMVLKKNLDIEAYCLCCMTDEVELFHPLFEGGLCLECKDNFTETLYRYDEDGSQSYCTVCCAGLEVILCGNDSCCRSYCVDCLNILVGPDTFDSLKEIDPWICYLCQPHRSHGALKPRLDWSVRVQSFFANNSGFQFEPHRIYPAIPANLRRPIKVLSLFDGISTGYLVLKELGFKVEKYVASEVCSNSIAVSEVNHEGKITHIDDVRFITKKHIEEWGPFDLLIGGSPCNDLSIVNPFRKGLYEGMGRLFFEYYRLLDIMKPKDDDPRPFFWMFENVVFMSRHDKANICRFLECNPVLVDAVKVSPARRARYFWGNIPGMDRPIIASQNDKVNLQDCLEVGRIAKFTKVRTITTNANSLKQGNKKTQPPVSEKGVDDNLWITEIEKIFGFPKHYTDVKNMNRQQRQNMLGKTWSVPVIRHLFAPLKDYFSCEQLSSNTLQPSSSPVTATDVGMASWCSPME